MSLEQDPATAGGREPEWIDEARELRAAGLTYAEIARRLAVTKASAYYWLNPSRCRRLSSAWKRRHGYTRTNGRQTDKGKTSSPDGQTMSDMEIGETRLSVRVPAALAAQFEQIAAQEERTVSAELRRLMRQRVLVADHAPAVRRVGPGGSPEGPLA